MEDLELRPDMVLDSLPQKDGWAPRRTYQPLQSGGPLAMVRLGGSRETAVGAGLVIMLFLVMTLAEGNRKG